MWGYVECANAGVPDSIQEAESQVEGGLTLCHEVKIIEIVAWVIAGISVLATIPVVKTYLERRKERIEKKKNQGQHKFEAGDKGEMV